MSKWMNELLPQTQRLVNNLPEIEQKLPGVESDKLKNDEAVVEINTDIKKPGLYK